MIKMVLSTVFVKVMVSMVLIFTPSLVYSQCATGTSSCSYEYISNVTVGSIDNSSACLGYADYTAQSTSMEIGTGYVITVTNGGGYASDKCKILVDWDDNLTFGNNANEIIEVGITGAGPYITTITPPAGASVTNVILRVNMWDDTYTGPDAGGCGTVSYGEAEDYTIAVTAACTEPTTAATSFSTNTITSSTMNYAFTRGNGNSVMVIAKAGSAPTDPTPGTSYTANAAYGSGDAVGGGYCIYNGTAAGASVATGNIAVTGLSSCTDYYYSVYEYATTGTCYKLAELTGTGTTSAGAVSTQAHTLTFTPSCVSALVGWTNGSGTKRIVICNTTNSFTAPVDGTDPSANSNYSSGEQVIYNGTGSSMTVLGLSLSTTYYFKVYEGTCTGSSVVWATSSGATNPSSTTTTASVSTLYWAGQGSVLAETTGNDFNTAANWSTSSGSFVLASAAPGACNDVVFTTDGNAWESSGDPITLSANTTVNNISFSHGGANKMFELNPVTYTMTINGTTTAAITSGNNSTMIHLNFTSEGNFIYNGACTFSASKGQTLPLLAFNQATTAGDQGSVTYGADVTFDSGGEGFATYAVPKKVIFDAPSAQSITNNATGTSMYMGETAVEIGGTNAPTVTIANNASDKMKVTGNLVVKAGATLDLTDETFNRNTAGGTLTLEAGATLRISASSGGQSGSNFPSNFTTFTLDPTSTVEYYGGAQTIYSGVTYGNLVINTAGTKTAGGALTVAGNFTVGASATFDGSTYTHNIGGNFTNSGTFTASTSTINFNSSSAAQTVTGATTFSGLTINNTYGSGSVTLNAAVTVSGALTLTSSNLITTSSNLLTLTTAATASSGSATSFVSGPMLKQAIPNSGSFVFPVGKGSTWRRTEVSAVAGGASDFTAEYNNTSYASTDVTGDLNNVTNMEHWIITKAEAASSAKVKLYWEDATAQGIDDCSDLTVGHWNGTAWEEYASTATGTCSGSNTGYVVTDAASTSFSPFTFASKVGVGNPLPIELIDFTAREKEGVVVLDWSTSTEVDNDYFTVEKSVDAKKFTEVTTVDGAGTSNEVLSYQTIDYTPYAGRSYYRLKQTDFNGNFSYSKVKMVNIGKDNNSAGMRIYPNPATGSSVFVELENPEAEVLIVVVDVLGRAHYSKVIFVDEGEGGFHVEDVSHRLPAGVYTVVATSANKYFKKKLVIN